MIDNRTHELFRRFPFTGAVSLSTGKAPKPYHVYSGSAIFIGGTINPDMALHFSDPEQMMPYMTTDSRALMGIWACDFSDASLGPHSELQFSLIASHDPRPLVEPHPFTILKLLATDPAARLLCHGLWNNQQHVVAYNSEYLGLNAALARSVFEYDHGHLKFTFDGAENSAKLISGSVNLISRTSAGVMFDLMRYFGLQASLNFTWQPNINARVVNTIGETLPANLDAYTFTHYDKVTLQYFDAAHAGLVIDHPAYRMMDFKPEFIQHMIGFKFVYLHPDDPAIARITA